MPLDGTLDFEKGPGQLKTVCFSWLYAPYKLNQTRHIVSLNGAHITLFFHKPQGQHASVKVYNSLTCLLCYIKKKNKVVKCITTKSNLAYTWTIYPQKAPVQWHNNVKNSPSVLHTWHPRLVDKPRKLCVHYTSSPALNGVADWACVSWEHTFLFGEVRETSKRCVGWGSLTAWHGSSGSVLKQSRWKWWNGAVCQLSPASANSTKTVSPVTQLIPIIVPERETSLVCLLPSAVHLQAVGQALPVKDMNSQFLWGPKNNSF